MNKKNVLVLHPNDELKLIDLQKRLAEKIEFPAGVKAFKKYPLWAFFNETTGLTELSEKIRTLSFSGVFVKSDGIYVKGFCDEKNIEILVFVFSRNLEAEESANLQKQIVSKQINCEFNVRVFRTGEANFEGNTFFLTDSKWKKLYERKEKDKSEK